MIFINNSATLLQQSYVLVIRKFWLLCDTAVARLLPTLLFKNVKQEEHTRVPKFAQFSSIFSNTTTHSFLGFYLLRKDKKNNFWKAEQKHFDYLYNTNTGSN